MPGRLRNPSWRALLVALLLCISSCGGAEAQSTGSTESAAPEDESASSAPIASDDTLRIYFMDVGQGDGALIVTPNGRTILVDGGPSSAGDDVVATLNRLGVHRINLMLTSHAHADHMGGFGDVLDSFEVMRYGDPGFPHTSGTYIALLEAVVGAGIDSYQLGLGQWMRFDEGIEARVLAPPDPPLSGTRSDVNSNSVVLLLTYGDVTILFTGDAEADTEAALIASGALRDVDVLKVAHHGSAHSTTDTFLSIVQPEIAVVSCGEGNSYGHPDPDTLARLGRYAGDHIFRTDLSGTIVLETDGRNIEVWAESGEPHAQLQAGGH